MPSDVTRDEFNHLTTRVDVVEGEVEGEKTVTRHILEQTRRNSSDFATIKSRVDRIEIKIDSLALEVRQGFAEVRQGFADVRQEFGRVWQESATVRQDLTGLRGMVAGLTTNLPSMIADVMRQVLRERDSKA